MFLWFYFFCPLFHLLLFYPHFWSSVAGDIFFLFCAATPLAVLYVALYSSWLAFLWKLYRSSLFVRLPALKICAQFIDCCVLWLAGFGGYCLLLLFCRGVLLIILSAFATVLLFSEKSLPFAACFLHFVTTCSATTAHSLTAIMSLPWNL